MYPPRNRLIRLAAGWQTICDSERGMQRSPNRKIRLPNNQTNGAGNGSRASPENLQSRHHRSEKGPNDQHANSSIPPSNFRPTRSAQRRQCAIGKRLEVVVGAVGSPIPFEVHAFKPEEASGFIQRFHPLFDITIGREDSAG